MKNKLNSREKFSLRLKELRVKKMQMTQKEFAELVESTPATISAYENATKAASLDIIVNIAKKCNVSIDWLCGLSEKESRQSYTTYRDILERFKEIKERVNLVVKFINYKYEEVKQDEEGKQYIEEEEAIVPAIIFHPRNPNEFKEILSDWIKYEEGYYETKILDAKMYNACTNGLLRDSEIPIKPKY